MVKERYLVRARELAAALRDLTLGGAPAMERHAGDLREVLGTEIALSYSTVEIHGRLQLETLHAGGLRDVDQQRRIIDTWLHAQGPRAKVAAFNPLRPEPAQQNRVLYPRALAPQGSRQRALLLPRLGLAQHEQMRALICEGGSLLSWVGALQPTPFRAWQQAAFEALQPSLQRRLAAERALRLAGFREAALDASLALIPGAALVLDARGQICACNHAARVWLSRGRDQLRDELERAGRMLPSAFQLVPFGGRGMGGHVLAVQRLRGPLTSREIAAQAALREQLTDKLCEVLELVVDGLDNATIARRLGNSVSTIEKHVSKLLRRFDVDNRAALVRAVTDQAPSSRAKWP